jgi:hypothetical protein
METFFLVAALCIALLVSLWKWEAEREARSDVEFALRDRERLWRDEVERLRAWLIYIRDDASAHHGMEDHLLHSHALIVEVPHLCTTALESATAPVTMPERTYSTAMDL